MMWETFYRYLPRYEHTSTNQYGDRYKRIDSIRVHIAKISCKCNDTDEMRTLILIGHSTNTPVKYDFDNHRAYVEVVSKDDIEKL